MCDAPSHFETIAQLFAGCRNCRSARRAGIKVQPLPAFSRVICCRDAIDNRALARNEMVPLRSCISARGGFTRLLERPIPLELRTQAQLTLAAAFLKQARPLEAKPVLEEAIAVAERAGWHQLLVDLYDRMGSVYYLLRRAHTAGQWFDKALEHLRLTERVDTLSTGVRLRL